MQTQRIESFQTIRISAAQKDGLLLWLIVLAVGVICLLIYPVMRLGFTYQINYNEGLYVYHQRDAVENRLMYGSAVADPLTPVSIPPVSLFLIGIPGRILGNYLITGRIISLLSLAALACLGACILRSKGTRWKAGLFGGLAIMALIAGYAPEYVGMNDPHLLALAFSFCGILIYTKYADTKFGLIASPLLLMIGLFTAPFAAAALLAVCLDILLRSPKRGIIWLGAAAVFFLICNALTSFQFTQIILDQLPLQSDFSTSRFLNQVNRLDFTFLILLLLSGWTALLAVFEPRTRIFAFYLAAALLIGILLSGGNPGGISQLFDLFAAMGLVMGLAVNRIPTTFKQIPGFYRTAVWCLAPLLTFLLLIHIPERLPRANSFNLLTSVQNGFLQDAAYLQKYPGRAYCENLLLCFLANKPLEMDALSSSDLAFRGRTDENLLLLIFESHQFDIVQLNRPLSDNLSQADYSPDILKSGSMTQNMRIAIARNYQVERKTTSGVFYSPR